MVELLEREACWSKEPIADEGGVIGDEGGAIGDEGGAIGDEGGAIREWEEGLLKIGMGLGDRGLWEIQISLF